MSVSEEDMGLIVIWEVPACLRATKLMHHDYWAGALEPRNHNYWAHAPHLIKTACPRRHAPQKEKPMHCKWRKSQHINEDPPRPTINEMNKFLQNSKDGKLSIARENTREARKGLWRLLYAIVKNLESELEAIENHCKFTRREVRQYF